MTADEDAEEFAVPDGWNVQALSQLADEERGISYGIVQPGHHVSGGVPIVRVQNIVDGTLDTSDMMRVAPEIAARYRRTCLRGGELLLSLVGSVGSSVIAPPELAGWNTARAVAVVPLRKGIDARFVRFCLRSSTLQHLMGVWCNTTDVCRLPIPLPPPHEREAIVETLAALDAKIEANRQMIRTLEELAGTLFRAWFVDFEPVVARAALFPVAFTDSELGPIPLDWRVGCTADLARYVNRRAFTKSATGTGRMVIRIGELNSGPGGSTVYHNIAAAPENIAHPGDLLFAWSGSLDVYRWHRDEALINQHIFKVVCEAYPQWFVHQALREAMPFFQDIAADKATTMGHIKREHLSEAKLALPDNLLAAAGRLIEPFYAKQLANERESLTLAALRDTLLPKLLSGELRVKDAEKQLA